MVAYAGGVVALVLGIIGIVFWWGHVLDILKGTSSSSLNTHLLPPLQFV